MRKLKLILWEIPNYLWLTSLLFLASNKNEDFFLCILPIFDNSAELKKFISLNKIEGIFLSDSFASYSAVHNSGATL